jgi:hypothetical protein
VLIERANHSKYIHTKKGCNSISHSATIVNAATGSAGVMAGVSIAGGFLALWKTANTKEEELYSPKPGSLAGQTIVVTDASTGLGLELAN